MHYLNFCQIRISLLNYYLFVQIRDGHAYITLITIVISLICRIKYLGFKDISNYFQKLNTIKGLGMDLFFLFTF